MESLPIYCINLSSAPDRWARVTRRLAAYGLTATRWDASTPASCRTPYVSYLTLNQRACAESHFRLWEHVVASGHSHVLILEDDAVFRKDWIPITNAKLKEPGWDALFLNVSEETSLEQWAPCHNQCMTAAYILTARAAAWLVATFRPCLYAADGMTQALQQAAPCLTYFPWLVIQEGRESYIQTKDHFDADIAKVHRLLAAADFPLSSYDF